MISCNKSSCNTIVSAMGLSALLIATSALALEPTIKTSQLNIIHKEGKLAACTSEVDLTSLEKKFCPTSNLAPFIGNDVSVYMVSDERLQIDIANPNFVLFNYTTGQLEQNKTATARDIDAFFDWLKSHPLTQTNPEEIIPTKDELKVGNVNVITLRATLSSMKNTKDELSNAADYLYKGNVTEASRIAREQKELIKKVVDMLDEVSDLKHNLEYFGEVTVTAKGRGCPDTGVEYQATELTLHKPPLLSRNSTKEEIQDDKDRVCVQNFFEEDMQFLEKVLAKVERKIQVVAELNSLAEAIEKSTLKHPLTTSNIIYSSQNNQIQHFTISKNTVFDNLISPAAKAYRDKAIVGEFTVTVEPKQNLIAYPAAGLFYSFVRNPTYSANKNAQGQLVITQQSNDINGVTGGLAMNFSTAAYDGEYFRPHLQVGLVPDKDKFAFMLGFGFDVPTTTSSIDIGLIYQNTKELTNGLVLGQQVTAQSDIVTSNVWKSGPYISLNYQIK